MGFSTAPASSKAVGDELAAVLPQDGKKWYQRTHLLKLNFILLSLVFFCKPHGLTRYRCSLTAFHSLCKRIRWVLDEWSSSIA